MKKVKEMEDCLDRLLKSSKPKLIMGSFENIKELTEQEIKHFDTEEYMWNTKPQTDSGPFKDKYMGVLLDESLKYVHIVFGSEQFLNEILT